MLIIHQRVISFHQLLDSSWRRPRLVCYNLFLTPAFVNNNMPDVHVQTSTLPNGATSTSYDFSARGDEDSDGSFGMPCIESSSMSAALTTSSSRAYSTNPINSGPTTTTSCRVPSGQQATTAEVSELVVKAKKAAASLWMILHSQVNRNH